MAAIKRQQPTLRVVGEVFDGDPAMLAFFGGGHRAHDGVRTGVDYLFDFPLFYPLRRAFGEGKPLKEVAQMLARDHLYPDPSRLVTFLGLHDVARFMHERGATPAGLRLGYTLLLTTRGTPLLYYGDEIGLPGGGDPDNRRDFPGGWGTDARNAFEVAGRSAEEQATWRHVQALLTLRRERPELRHAPTEHLVVTDQQFAYRRGASVVILNNDTTAVTVRVPTRGPLPPAVIGGCPAPRLEGGDALIPLPPRSGCVF
jgi:glycosidase